jgi:hypothetical protein
MTQETQDGIQNSMYNRRWNLIETNGLKLEAVFHSLVYKT